MTKATHIHFIGILAKSKKQQDQPQQQRYCLFSEGCDVAIYISKLVELFHDGKQLNIIAYTDSQSLYNAAHILNQTLEKQLLVDISAIGEMDERNKINTTWIEKTKQISDILTKAQASPNIILKLDIAKLKHELYDLLLKQLIKKQTNVE